MAAMDAFTEEYLAEKQIEVSKKLNEFRVLDSELQNIKKDARVYVQQPNSLIFFQSDNKDKVKVLCKDSIEKLKKQEKRLDDMGKFSR